MIKVKKFVVNHFLENTYLVYDENTREAVMIDPGAREAKIDDAIVNENLKLTSLVCTHCHPDHIAGARYYKEKHQVPFLMHQEEKPVLDSFSMWGPMLGFNDTRVPDPDGFLKPGDGIKIGESRLDIIPTPGHTPGGVCFHCVAQKILFSGDTLFNQSIGRTDLPGGDTELILTSIHEQLLTLPEDTRVLPGHGEDTTIGAEKVSNPFLA